MGGGRIWELATRKVKGVVVSNGWICEGTRAVEEQSILLSCLILASHLPSGELAGGRPRKRSVLIGSRRRFMGGKGGPGGRALD